jgi:DNA helicase-2/ATP-dependent DNA helicase PcrA
MAIGDHLVRGRIDAVFADEGGGVLVLDWKTGAPPAGTQARRQAAVQLAVYRLAVAALRDCPVSQVRAAFHYVRSGHTVMPDDLPGPEELAALLIAPAS